jgi:hypothetical protein
VENVNQDENQRRRGRWSMFAVLLVCAAPILASYLTYFFIKPEGRTNYGDLLDPRQHPIPVMATTSLDGAPQTLDDFKGKWIMLKVGGSACDQKCQDMLFAMRQLRTMQGKDADRIERVWLITDKEPLETFMLRVNDGTRFIRAPADAVNKWLPLEQGGKVEEHIFLIDPMGHLMMRFPKDADPAKVKKDLVKVLKASAIG